MDPARELAQLVEGLGELGARRLERVARLRVRACGHPQVDREGDEALLGAVVQVALQALPLGVAGLHQPDAGGRELLPRLRVGERLGRQLGEVGDPLLGARRERLRVDAGDDHRAPQPAAEHHRGGHRAAEAQVVAQPLGERPRDAVVAVEAHRAAGPPDAHGGRVAVHHDPFADRHAGEPTDAPAPHDGGGLVVLVAHEVRRLGAEQAPDLLGDEAEHARRVLLDGHGRRHAPQRRLLLGQVAQGLLGLAPVGHVAQVAAVDGRAGHVRLRDRHLDRELAAVGAHGDELVRMVHDVHVPGRHRAGEAAPVRVAQRRAGRSAPPARGPPSRPPCSRRSAPRAR